MRAWPLEKKIAVSKTKIIEWYQHWNGQVYVSFSGGKDSTILLLLARSIYPDIPAVFCDTGLEYPEIRDFVKLFSNVEWIYPVMWDRSKQQYKRCSFRKVITEYGYPVVSKQVSNVIEGARRNPNSVRGQRIRGELPDANGNPGKSQFNCSKWAYLLDAPFKISDHCCSVMKKTPAALYDKRTGRHPMLGLMAEESNKRRIDYLKTGCNAFEKKKPQSQPIGFWSEQDVLQFLAERHDELLSTIKQEALRNGCSEETAAELRHPWAPVYGELSKCNDGYRFSKTDRTGCMFCAYGCGLEGSPTRFELMRNDYPQQYEYCMRTWDHGGLGLNEVLTYIGVAH